MPLLVLLDCALHSPSYARVSDVVRKSRTGLEDTYLPLNLEIKDRLDNEYIYINIYINSLLSYKYIIEKS